MKGKTGCSMIILGGGKGLPQGEIREMLGHALKSPTITLEDARKLRRLRKQSKLSQINRKYIRSAYYRAGGMR